MALTGHGVILLLISKYCINFHPRATLKAFCPTFSGRMFYGSWCLKFHYNSSKAACFKIFQKRDLKGFVFLKAHFYPAPKAKVAYPLRSHWLAYRASIRCGLFVSIVMGGFERGTAQDDHSSSVYVLPARACRQNIAVNKGKPTGCLRQRKPQTNSLSSTGSRLRLTCSFLSILNPMSSAKFERAAVTEQQTQNCRSWHRLCRHKS